MASSQRFSLIPEPPPFPPPRRRASLPNPTIQDSSSHVDFTAQTARSKNPPPFLPPRIPCSTSSRKALRNGAPKTTLEPESSASSRSSAAVCSLPESLQSEPDHSTLSPLRGIQRSISAHHPRDCAVHTPTEVLHSPRQQALRDLERPGIQLPGVLRYSSLRSETSVFEKDERRPSLPIPGLATSSSMPELRFGQRRPHSHPLTKLQEKMCCRNGAVTTGPVPSPLSGLGNDDDPWKLPRMHPGSAHVPAPPPVLTPRPRTSLHRFSSLDNLITYREEKAEWKRASSILQQRMSQAVRDVAGSEGVPTTQPDRSLSLEVTLTNTELSTTGSNTPKAFKSRNQFRHFSAEMGFCFSIAMTQFLAEFLISGFALELPRMFFGQLPIGPKSLGLFWPASLLSLLLSATLLIFARLSDLHGGYPLFMFGATWLTIWTLMPGFVRVPLVLDVSRAMEGLALAALTPSTFAMVGSFYSEGPRKNFVMGLYSGCAPLGFFAGFLTAGALPQDKSSWYFWIAGILSGVTAVTAYLTVPHDKTNRKALGLKMDWSGGFLIMAGLILLSYALAVEPYAAPPDTVRSGFRTPAVLGPLVSGLACLAVALWYEGWVAQCPLLPFAFFCRRSVLPLCLAGLCFYASYGVWLYNSAEFFESPTGTTSPDAIRGIALAIWYIPTAVGGLVLCVIGGALVHIVPIKLLLLISGFAWIAAPLLLAVSPLPLHYWSAVLPSMLCATLGIDLTFTVSIIFLSSVQPLKYQGLSGAVCSILVNLGIAFSLSISEIVTKKAESAASPPTGELTSAGELAASDHAINWGYQAAFVYAAASAGLGFVISVLYVHISRGVMRKRPIDIEAPRASSSE